MNYRLKSIVKNLRLDLESKDEDIKYLVVKNNDMAKRNEKLRLDINHSLGYRGRE